MTSDDFIGAFLAVLMLGAFVGLIEEVIVLFKKKRK